MEIFDRKTAEINISSWEYHKESVYLLVTFDKLLGLI